MISRRKLMEEERRTSKEKILSEIEVGQLHKGVVKNIADFGVFVDLCANHNMAYRKALAWLGHSSSQILDLYYHLHDEDSRQAMMALAGSRETKPSYDVKPSTFEGNLRAISEGNAVPITWTYRMNLADNRLSAVGNESDDLQENTASDNCLKDGELGTESPPLAVVGTGESNGQGRI